MTDSVGDPVEDIELVKLNVILVEGVKEEEGLEEGEFKKLPELETDGMTL